MEALNVANDRQYPATSSSNSLMKDLADEMLEFVYDPENNLTFSKWYARYSGIFIENAEKLTDNEAVRLILQKLAQKQFDKFADTILPKTPSDLKLKDAVEVLTRIFGKKETIFAQRRKCMGLKMEESEDFSDYSARVNKHGERFDVAKFTADDLKVLMFVQGLDPSKNALVIEKLLTKVDSQYIQLEAAADPTTIKKLNLQDLVNEAERIKCLKSDAKSIGTDASKAEIFAVTSKTGTIKKTFDKSRSSFAKSDNGKKEPRSPCWFCSGCHFHADCPYKDRVCPKCKQFGHKESHCEQVAEWKKKRATRPADVNRVAVNAVRERRCIEPIIGGQKLKLQLDTGSDWTIISRANWKVLGSPDLMECGKAFSACRNEIPMLGKFPCRMKLNGQEATGSVHVAEDDSLNLFGDDWFEKLGLKVVQLKNICNAVTGEPEGDAKLVKDVKAKFPKLFAPGLGLCNKMKASLTLKDGAKPIYRNKRPVPFAAAEDIERELKRLQSIGVITPINYSSYAAPLVAVKKQDGSTRICADYSRGLNDALEPNKHPLPTPDDIFAQLSGKRIFSKIDLSDAFLQIELDDEAKKIMPINTHCGLFQVNRLQPGIKTAPGIFQQLMETMLSGAEGCFAFMDDFIVAGKDVVDHRNALFDALGRVESYGFRLKLGKCSFGKTMIDFLGHTVDAAGIHPKVDKIEFIKQIPAPKDVSELRALLGAVNWYGKFIPKLKELRGQLDQLLCNDVEFKWNKEHEEAFCKLKDVLSSDLALTHYDPKKKIIVAADASSYGIGAVLMHEMADGTKRPIMHASASFTKAEQNYPQIQREALALKFAVTKFHRYIYGRAFELQTDHEPLLAIFGSKKGIPVFTASRLQRYALVLRAYDFTIKYVNTRSFGYADFISRLIANTEKPDEDVVIASIRAEEDGESMCYAINAEAVLPVKFEAVKAETARCPTLIEVRRFIDRGWPEKKSQIPDEAVAEFHGRRKALAFEEGCIFFQGRIVIPQIHRKAVLEELHDGHPGETRMKSLARTKVFWPKIDDDIVKHVRQCEPCATNAQSPTKCSLQTWPAPKGSWSRVHIDYAGPVKGFYFLVIVDAFSKWPEIFKMSSTTTQKTIEKLRETFARFGNCDTIVSDNGPQFSSMEFQTFCAAIGVKHITSAPYHPQSNGQAERFVKQLKMGLRKLDGEGNIDRILQKFLMSYRSTPSFSLNMKSPAQVMFGRDMKTKLDLLKPSDTFKDDRNTKMEAQFDHKHGAKWKEFAEGDDVYYKFPRHNGWRWLPAVVVAKRGAVDYIISVTTGTDEREIKAHANQLTNRYTDAPSDENLLLDMFDLPEPMQDEENEPMQKQEEEVEPMIIPEPAEEGSENGSLYEDAQTENIIDEKVNVAEPSQLRRSARTTLGVPPERYITKC